MFRDPETRAVSAVCAVFAAAAVARGTEAVQCMSAVGKQPAAADMSAAAVAVLGQQAEAAVLALRMPGQPVAEVQ